MPGLRPVMSATTFTSSPEAVKVTVPVTLLPLAEWSTAIALVGSAALALEQMRETPAQRTPALIKRRIG